LLYREHGIEHRLNKSNHPWTNSQVERMNRTIKEATVRRYHYDSRQQLKQHLKTFMTAYNCLGHLKTLRRLTQYDYIWKCRTETLDRFRLSLLNHTARQNTLTPSKCQALPQALSQICIGSFNLVVSL